MRRKMLGGFVLAVTLAVTGAGPGMAQAAPAAASSAGTFYTPPSDLASLAPGAVIRSRTVGVPAYGIPLPVQAWQLVYRSNNTAGTAIAATTTVIIPPGKPAGPRPLISYPAIINALDPECSPSRTVPNGGLARSSCCCGRCCVAGPSASPTMPVRTAITGRTPRRSGHPRRRPGCGTLRSRRAQAGHAGRSVGVLRWWILDGVGRGAAAELCARAQRRGQCRGRGACRLQ